MSDTFEHYPLVTLLFSISFVVISLDFIWNGSF